MQQYDQWPCFRPCQFVFGRPVGQLDSFHLAYMYGHPKLVVGAGKHEFEHLSGLWRKVP